MLVMCHLHRQAKVIASSTAITEIWLNALHMIAQPTQHKKQLAPTSSKVEDTLT